jgi:hypothetical protein
MQKTGRVLKFVHPSQLDPSKNAIFNALKSAKLLVKRGQLRGIAILAIQKGKENIGAFWSVEDDGAFNLLAASDYLKQQVWHAIHTKGSHNYPQDGK